MAQVGRGGLISNNNVEETVHKRRYRAVKMLFVAVIDEIVRRLLSAGNALIRHYCRWRNVAHVGGLRKIHAQTGADIRGAGHSLSGSVAEGYY